MSKGTSLRKITAMVFILIAVVLSVIFYSQTNKPESLEGVFYREYYGQFGPLTICIELFIAGIYLFNKDKKANFALALFAFSAILDSFFNLIDLFASNVPLYGSVIFLICAIISLYLAFSNKFNLGKISLIGALGSFILGTAVELFFNYF